MYLVGLEKTIKTGHDLGLTGAALRNYFDTEKVKLKEQLALRREAIRLGVDPALVGNTSDKESALRELEQKEKNKHEKTMAALNKKIAALKSRILLVHPDGISLTPQRVTGCKPSHMTNPLVSPPSDSENRSLVQKTIYGLQETKQQEKSLSGDTCGALLNEASHLPLISSCRADNSDPPLPAPQTDDDGAEDPVADKAQDSPLIEAYSNPAPEITNAKGLRTVSEIFPYSRRLSRKRKSRKKTSILSDKQTSVCAPHSRRSQTRECHGSCNHCEKKYLPAFSCKSKHDVMPKAGRFLNGSSLRGSVRLCNHPLLSGSPREGVRRVTQLRTSVCVNGLNTDANGCECQKCRNRVCVQEFHRALFLPDHPNIHILLTRAGKEIKVGFIAEGHAAQRGRSAEFSRQPYALRLDTHTWTWKYDYDKDACSV